MPSGGHRRPESISSPQDVFDWIDGIEEENDAQNAAIEELSNDFEQFEIDATALYVQASEPMDAGVGDMWIDTDEDPTSTVDILAMQDDIADLETASATHARKVLIEALDYGDLSDDPADAAANVTTLNAAIAAAIAAGGTEVAVPAMEIPINANVEFDGVGLIGAGRNKTQFIATHANARLTFTQVSNQRIKDFTFDGDSIATLGMQVKELINAMHMANVTVDRCIRGASFHDVQNSYIDKLIVDRCTVGHLAVVDGCGSNVFNALGCANFAATSDLEYALFMGYEGVVASGYDEPTANTFINPMLEMDIEAGSGRGVVMIEGSSRTLIINGNIVNGEDAWMVNVETTLPATDGKVQLTNCSLLSGPAVGHGLRISGGAQVTLQNTGFVGALVGVEIDTSGRLFGQTPYFNNVGTEYSCVNGAVWYSALEREAEVGRFRFFSEGGDGWIPPVLIGQTSDGGGQARTFLYGDGRIGFSGGSYSADTTFGRDSANCVRMEAGNSFKVDGTWNGGMLRFGDYRLWVDSTGDLRIKNGAPSSDTDGTVVGTQS